MNNNNNDVFVLIFENWKSSTVVFEGTRKACIWKCFQLDGIMLDKNGKIVPHYDLADDEVYRIYKKY